MVEGDSVDASTTKNSVSGSLVSSRATVPPVATAQSVGTGPTFLCSWPVARPLPVVNKAKTARLTSVGLPHPLRTSWISVNISVPNRSLFSTPEGVPIPAIPLLATLAPHSYLVASARGNGAASCSLPEMRRVANRPGRPGSGVSATSRGR